MIKFISFRQWEQFRIEEIEVADFDALPSSRVCGGCDGEGGSDCDCDDGCGICEHTQFVWCAPCGGTGIEDLQARDEREMEALNLIGFQDYIDDVVEHCKRLAGVGFADLLTSMADFYRQQYPEDS